jgi:hypothetical protein
MKLPFFATSVVALVAAAVAMPGCSSSEDFYCEYDLVTVHACHTIPEVSDTTTTVGAQTVCSASAGKKVDACPTAAELGTCKTTNDMFTYTTAYYSDTGGTAEAAEKACTDDKGTWTAAE